MKKDVPDEQKRLLDHEEEEEDDFEPEIERLTSIPENHVSHIDAHHFVPNEEYDEEPYLDDHTHVLQNEWLRSHNGLRKFQSQRRRDVPVQPSFTGNPDMDHAYQNGYNQRGVYIGDGQESEDNDFFITMNIEDWLDGPYAVYIKQFKVAGYDDTTFLMGMKEPDLVEIGIENRGHRKKILAEIARLPPEDIDQDVPVCISNAFFFFFLKPDSRKRFPCSEPDLDDILITPTKRKTPSTRYTLFPRINRKPHNLHNTSIELAVL